MHRGYKCLETPIHKTLSVKNVDVEGFNKEFYAECENMGISVGLNSATKDPNTDTQNYVYTIEVPSKFDEDEILKLIPYECSIKTD